MAVLKEYVCMAHGDFDSKVSRCPHGCSGEGMVQRVFRTAPAVQSAGYRNINRSFETLAREHGLTNMNNRSSFQDGTGMRRADAATHERLRRANEMVVQVGDRKGLDAGQFFKPLKEFTPGSTGPAGGALQKHGATMVTSLGVPLPPPRAVPVAAGFDGTQLGLPAGDTA